MTTIVYLYSRGGAALEYALPILAQRGEVHVIAVQPLPSATEHRWRPACRSVTDLSDRPPLGEELVDLVTARAEALSADLVFTLSEHAVLVVAEVSRRLGLRGPGSNAVRSRDKRLMRETWRAAGVPVPRFMPVATVDELAAAVDALTPPVLLKSAWGAGSLGQLVVRSAGESRAAWAQCHESLGRAQAGGPLEYLYPSAGSAVLAEEIVNGDPDGWLATASGYGDYLSVEGLVLDGRYHPLCVAARLPTIPPFTELGCVLPCVLPDHLQKVVEEAARGAVDALGLENCGTHTELKLLPGHEVSVIESAARIGGMMIARQMVDVFGIDPIGMLVDHSLGRPVDLPDRMLTAADADGATASVVLIGTDATGRPWDHDLVWDPAIVDWDSLVSPGTTVEPVDGLTIPSGSTFPRYGLADGSRCAAGLAYVRAGDSATLMRDSRAVIDGLENGLLGTPSS
jgi:biotin carboxylase